MSKEFNSHKKYQPLVLDIQGFYKQRAKHRNRVAVRRLSRQIDHEVRLRKAADRKARAPQIMSVFDAMSARAGVS